MNITDKIIAEIDNPYKEIVVNNPQIQFYLYNEGYCFRDTRCKSTLYEHDNFESRIEDVIQNFKDHIDVNEINEKQ